MSLAVENKVDNKRILRAIQEELEYLPSLPAVIMRIMQLTGDPNTSAKTLQNMISADPPFAAKVLQLVNSSAYGYSGKITTISQAIVILGFPTIRNLAMSLGVGGGMTPTKPQTALDLRGFWGHSLATALAASIVGRRKNVSAKILEEVFVGGLLHDIGKLFLNCYFSGQYAVTLRYAQTAPTSVLAAERHTLGVSHTIVGAKISEKWQLPPGTAAMIAYHHNPGQAEAHMESASIVHAADYIARKLKLGNAGNTLEPLLVPEVDQWLCFLPNTWDGIERETAQKFEGAADFLQAMLGR